MTLPTVLTDGTHAPGVYHLQSWHDLTTLDTAVTEAGWHGVVLNGRNILTKAELLTAVAQAFNFPSYFGHNWDALDDMLRDLSWLPAAGYVVFLEDFEALAAHDQATWRTFVEIWKETTAVWWADGVPMFVFIRGEAGHGLVASDLIVTPET